MSNVGKMSKNSKYDKDGKANVVGVVLVLFSASLRRPTKLYNICNSSSDNSGALPGSFVNVFKKCSPVYSVLRGPTKNLLCMYEIKNYWKVLRGPYCTHHIADANGSLPNNFVEFKYSVRVPSI